VFATRLISSIRSGRRENNCALNDGRERTFTDAWEELRVSGVAETVGSAFGSSGIVVVVVVPPDAGTVV